MSKEHVTFCLNNDDSKPLFTLTEQSSPPDVLAMFREMHRWIAELKLDVEELKKSKLVYIGDKKMAKKPRLGSGARFKAIEEKAAKSGAKNPAAVAASVAIKKYGKSKLEKLAHAGKARKAKEKAK